METESTEKSIDLYITGKMDPDTKKAFEQRISDDKLLAKEVEAVRSIREAIGVRAEKDILKSMEGLSEGRLKAVMACEEDKYLKRKSRPLKVFFPAAAAAVLLAVLIFGLQYKYDAPTIYEQYKESFELEYITYISRGAERIEDLPRDRIHSYEKATEAYTAGDYAASSELFEMTARGIPLEELPHELILYWAASLMETGETAQAIHKLEFLIRNGDRFYWMDAQWLMGRIYIQEGERAKAVEIFTRLASDSEFYGTRAAEILKKLRKRNLF